MVKKTFDLDHDCCGYASSTQTGGTSSTADDPVEGILRILGGLAVIQQNEVVYKVLQSLHGKRMKLQADAEKQLDTIREANTLFDRLKSQ